ncbi:MAG: glyoxylase-like metal-dependent hydrolase (beta-lactamase superfamily II) [Candidatus Promineifilaceae bacterium]|jgi:glyoxylase-like metal-dependent hydrolase (beta-lactamase superfamily II)
MAKFADVQSKTVGDFKITYLNDGGGYITPEAMYPSSSSEGWTNYKRLLDDEGRLVISIGGFLIETGDKKIIMDLGFGPQTVEFPGFGPFIGGDFMNSLAKTGVSADQITDVVFTHLHLDHVGWTSTDGKLTFPNAKHMATQADWDFWSTDESGMGMHPEAVAPFLKEHLNYINAGDEIAPGMKVLATPGHTPGHISLHITAGDQEVYLIADLLHSEVQFYEEEWFVAFDIDPAQGRATREGIYADLARGNVLVGDGHFADSVFGTITLNEGKPQWHPAG